jgi:hypothetical protein
LLYECVVANKGAAMARQAARSQAAEQASQDGSWRSAKVKDDSQISMATWEIADAGESVDGEQHPAAQAAASSEPAQAA